jgi:hypothetical protein
MPTDGHSAPVFNPYLFFFVVSFSPIIITFVCLFFFYTSHDHSPDSVLIPMISEAVVTLPESRLFSVGISVEAWLSVPLFLIISRMLKLMARIADVHRVSRIRMIGKLIECAAFVAFFSMLGMASINIVESKRYHMISVVSFLLSLSLFFFLVDWQMCEVNLTVTLVDWIWDAVCPVCFVLSLGIWEIAAGDSALLNVAAILQYIGGAALFLKFWGVWRAWPPVGLMLTKKSE